MPRNFRLSLAFFVTTFFAACEGYAASSSQEEAPDHWYGWQTLIADGGSLAIGITGGILGAGDQTPASSALLYSAAAGYVAGAPAVHWATGHVNAGFWSLGLRLGLPTTFGLLGYSLKPCSETPPDRERHSDDFACFPYVLGGAAIGGLLAVIIDNAVVAREAIPSTKEAALPRLSITPVADFRGVGITFRGTL
jgi:hypothetical protein